MLSNDDFERVQEQLNNNPTYLKLLYTLWPRIKDHDFTNSKSLNIVKPMNYEIMCTETDPRTLKMTKKDYSHRAYRTVLGLLGLVPSSKFTQKNLLIRQKT